MTDKTRFDEIIKENLMKRHGASEFGYTVPGAGASYGLYYSNRAFRDFLAEMNAPEYRAIHDAFKNGQGAEIDERRYGGRVYPPKMASVASSARFCYLALRQGAEDAGDRAWIDGLFEELKTEITAIFSSRPIRAFAAAHGLGLQAWAEHAEVMGPLTTENAIRLF